MIAPPLWKASVALKKAQAPDVVALFEITPPRPQAVLTAEEPFKDEAVVEALYDIMPDGDLLSKLAGKEVRVILLPDLDWIKLSQEGLPPVRAVRFFVYGAHDAGQVPPGVIPIRIEAGLAFGTGHHETTALCLAAMSDLAKRRQYRNVLDLGCGTGLLAIGAARLWRRRVIASDIDPVAVAVTRENAAANGEGPRVDAVLADGPAHPMIAKSAPFDLILANILAGPLTRLAPGIARVVAPRGTLVLSGLLRWQENLVLSFYRQQGLVLRATRRDGSWSALVMERPGALCAPPPRKLPGKYRPSLKGRVDSPALRQ
jgi:ribosomal protein L11 methyltransferase